MTQASPQDTLDILLARSQEARTPCGEGQLVWRIWGNHARPAVVLLHGGFGAWNHWVRNIPALEADYRVIVPDLPGCGDSDQPPARPDAESLASILSAGLDLVVREDTPFDLMGFSFGGLLAGPIAQIQSRRVRSLTIVGTPILGLTTTGPANALQPVPPDMAPEEAAPIYRRNLEKLMVHNPDAVDDLAMTLHMENMAKTRLRSRGIARRTIAADSLRGLACRMGFIYGAGDVTLDPDLDAVRAAAADIQPEAPFHVVPNTGHWVQYEAADRFNPLMARLLGAPA
ncbi:MAG: alpha/beta fold hydrolase [Proteobacteria bacterium]|nr:alpha/beta fold hydrolase [Pseudomonadota bacterium]